MRIDAIDVNHADPAHRPDHHHRPMNQGNPRAKNRTSALTQRIERQIADFFKNASNPTRSPDLNMSDLPSRFAVAHKLSLYVTFTTLGHDLVPT